MSSKDDGVEKTNNKPQLEQYRVDNLIVAAYYAAVSNITLQTLLPTEPDESEQYRTYKTGLDQSCDDFRILKSWIVNTSEYERKIENSPVKHLYVLLKDAENTEEFLRNR